MSDGRSIRLPSAKFAQVREPGRIGPAFNTAMVTDTRDLKSANAL